MFVIRRKTLGNIVVESPLASGETEKEAWNDFNTREVYLNFDEKIAFICEESEE